MSRGDGLTGELARIVGTGHVLTDPHLRAPYETDWSRRWSAQSRLVVRPGDTEQVAQVVACCARANVPLVPQGGNTGLVGGGVPRGGEVVLSLARLTQLEPVDHAAAQVTAGAGVTLGALQAHVRAAGFAFGVDLAARDSATIGGMTATNAGGIHVVRHGPMRAHVAGLEAVLADGTVVRRMSGLVKDNSGYDLVGLLTGSEGTLAVITAARLRLVPPHPRRVVALLGVESTAAAVTLLGRLRWLPSLVAIEIVYADGLALVAEHLNEPVPLSSPVAVLLECAAQEDPTDELAAALADAPEVEATAVATERPARAALWGWRERHTEAINAHGIPHKLDVAVPLDRLAAFEAQVRRLAAAVAPHSRTLLFGHLADGNLHVNVLGVDRTDEDLDGAILQLVAEFDGSISAEHGIGVAKRRWLALTRSDADVAVMRAVKQAFDPAHLLNPGVLFPP